MSIKYLEEFEMEDQTQDFDSDFHYTFIVGVNEEKGPLDSERTIYTDMSGYVNDAAADNFAVNVYNDYAYDNGGYRAYYIDKSDQQHFIDLPDEVKVKLEQLTKEAVMVTEAEKIKECVVYHAEGERLVETAADGLFTMDDIGDFNGNPVYADFHAEVRKNENGDYYMSPVYNMDEDKAYIIVPNEEFVDGKIYFDMPHDVLERCEKSAVKAAHRIMCDEMHQKYYDEYVQHCKDGFEAENEEDMYGYEEWLSTAYPDEGYFVGHIVPEDAKYLCEHDELLSLDYVGLYEDKAKGCFSLKGRDLIEEEAKTYSLNDAGLLHEDMDTLIARSDRPNLVAELCKEYDIKADSYTDFFFQMGDMSAYVAFEVDDSVEIPPVVTATVTLSLPNEVIDLNQIPLSDSETAFVLRAVDQYKGLLVDEIHHRLYEEYKEEWLKEHVSEPDWNAVEAEWERLEYQVGYESFEEFYEEVGFANGSCYVCYNEFLDCEYQDTGWIANHLTADDAVFLAENDEYFPLTPEQMHGTKWKDGKTVSVLGCEMTVDKKNESKERD